MEFSVVTLLWVMYALSCAIGGGLLVWVLLGYFDSVPPTAVAPPEPQCPGVWELSGDWAECSCGLGWDTSDPNPPEGHAGRVLGHQPVLIACADPHGVVLTEWLPVARVSVLDELRVGDFTCTGSGTALFLVSTDGGKRMLTRAFNVEAGQTLRVTNCVVAG
jgi:hypothetical protein